MKIFKSLILLLAFGFAFTSQAQSNAEELNIFQSLFGMEKKAMYSSFISLEEDKATAFWTIYDEYEVKRKELGVDRIKLLQDYAENYFDLTPEKTDELMMSLMKQKKNIDLLMNTYYKKIKKEAGSKPAAQFLQLETYISSVIRVGIFESIPMIDEWKK